MDKKEVNTLEYGKVLERLAQHTVFAVSREMALSLHPTTQLEEARRLLAETGEARLVLKDQPQFGIGGARDIRTTLESATRGQALTPGELLDVKGTLIAARTISRYFQERVEPLPLLR